MPIHAMAEDMSAFSRWLQNLEKDAIQEGVSEETVHAALDPVMLDQRVLDLDQKQPETTATFSSYIKNILTSDRIEQGRLYLHQYASLLDGVSARYGVPPEIIVALWGIESHFGQYKGKYHIVDSLATLAYEGRRSDFFRKELINALHILDQNHLSATALRGSWAGAMGQCQFIPSTYLHYAVDYSGKGFPNIWTNNADVFASIANYISAEGWIRSQSWGQKIHLTQDLSSHAVGLDVQKTLGEWKDLGVTFTAEDRLPAWSTKASVIQPDGEDGPSFIVFDNYRAVMKWNRSTYFATAVGLLADRIRND